MQKCSEERSDVYLREKPRSGVNNCWSRIILPTSQCDLSNIECKIKLINPCNTCTHIAHSAHKQQHTIKYLQNPFESYFTIHVLPSYDFIPTNNFSFAENVNWFVNSMQPTTESNNSDNSLEAYQAFKKEENKRQQQHIHARKKND